MLHIPVTSVYSIIVIITGDSLMYVYSVFSYESHESKMMSLSANHCTLVLKMVPRMW